MKKNIFTKIAAGILSLTIVLSSVGFSFPEKANAQFAVIDAAQVAQNVILIANTAGTAASTYASQLESYVLNTLATALAKQLIRTITASVVNWINTGFEGSPSFITNPGGFFLDVADQMTGDFLSKYGGPLTSLCSPFSIDIRLALSFKYHPNIPKRYECTLSKIITNSINAGKGATINGFAAGDFNQGGWPAFVSMTTEPQNNVMGAYLEADSELSIRVANAQIGKKEEINNGKGFLSWRDKKCTADVKAHNDAITSHVDITPVAASSNPVDSSYDPLADSSPGGGPGGDVVDEHLQNKNDCPIQTPGSLIVSNLETSVNGPLHELELVDSINEVVNALAAQLVTTVLQKGLAAASGSGPSDQTAYINQIQNEANTAQVTSLKNDFLKNVETYIANTLQYKTNKDQSLNLFLDAKSAYDAVDACYTGKIRGNQPNLNQAQVAEAQSKIAETDAIINTSINPQAALFLSRAKDADTRYKTLTDLRDQGTAAQTLNDINAPISKYSLMAQNQTLVSQSDIVLSQAELDSVKSQTTTMKQDAQRRLQECQIFPYATGGSIFR